MANAIYDDYPHCAVRCLVYNCTKHPDNFANNCDYASGECCTYRASIAATWDCVWPDCGRNKSLEAFDMFFEFCDEVGCPPGKKDVPKGYESVWDNVEDDDDNFGGTGLTKAQVIGIAVSAAVTATIAILGIVLKCYFDEFCGRWFRRDRFYQI